MAAMLPPTPHRWPQKPPYTNSKPPPPRVVPRLWQSGLQTWHRSSFPSQNSQFVHFLTARAKILSSKCNLGPPPAQHPLSYMYPPPAPLTPGAQRPAQRALEARKGRHLQTPKVLTEGLAHTSERPQAPLPAPTAARTARTPAGHIHPGGGAGVGGVVPKIFRVSAKGRQNRCVGRDENHVGL